QLGALDHLVGLPDVVRVELPAEPPGHPLGERGPQRRTGEPSRVAQVAGVDQLVQRGAHRVGRGEVHVRDPGRQHVRARVVAPLRAGLPPQPVEVQAVEDLVADAVRTDPHVWLLLFGREISRYRTGTRRVNQLDFRTV